MKELDEAQLATPFGLFYEHVRQMQSMGCNPYGYSFKNIMALRLLFFSGNVACLCRAWGRLSGYELALLLNIILSWFDSELVTRLASIETEPDPPSKITLEPITPQAPPLTTV